MITLRPDRPWYVWGEEIRVEYFGDPGEFTATAPLAGAVEIFGTQTPVSGSLMFSAVLYAPQMDGYVFEPEPGDASGRVWIGRPA